MSLGQFRARFPLVQTHRGSQADYDPDLWAKTTQFHEYASSTETIEGISFDIYLTFSRGRLVFLQYFGRPGPGAEGYHSACRAFEILAGAMAKTLGPPERTAPLKDYAQFAAEPRPTDGRPDERYVEAGSQTWPRAWIHLSENSPGTLDLELRIDSDSAS